MKKHSMAARWEIYNSMDIPLFTTLELSGAVYRISCSELIGFRPAWANLLDALRQNLKVP